jgi:Protein of unknown function (DUF3592)
MATMTPDDYKADSAVLGPLLILLAGAALAGVMLYRLIDDLRFLWAGVSVEATITGKSEERSFTLSFTDRSGDPHIVTSSPQPRGSWEKPQVGDELVICYLESNPERFCTREELRASWPWKLVWGVLGLVMTAFGVLLMWGRRPRRPKRWRSSPDRPW